MFHRRRLCAFVATALLILAGFMPAAGGATRETRLVLIGGGEFPRNALARISAWANDQEASILVIGWASGQPQAGYDYFVESLAPFKPREVVAAPPRETIAQQKGQFLAQLARATGVFFSGGDQNRIMDVLVKEPDLHMALHEKFQSGAVFAGNSAGTAVMSKTMLTGEGDPTVIGAGVVGVRDGLGFTPGVVLDQHFIRRQRLNRLLSVMLTACEPVGMGIDEDTAVTIVDNRLVEVMGKGQVVLIDKRENRGKFSIALHPPGTRLDLATGKRIVVE